MTLNTIASNPSSSYLKNNIIYLRCIKLGTTTAIWRRYNGHNQFDETKNSKANWHVHHRCISVITILMKRWKSIWHSLASTSIAQIYNMFFFKPQWCSIPMHLISGCTNSRTHFSMILLVRNVCSDILIFVLFCFNICFCFCFLGFFWDFFLFCLFFFIKIFFFGCQLEADGYSFYYFDIMKVPQGRGYRIYGGKYLSDSIESLSSWIYVVCLINCDNVGFCCQSLWRCVCVCVCVWGRG